MGIFGKIGRFFHHAYNKIKAAGHAVGKWFSRGAGRHIVHGVQAVADTAAGMGSKRGMAIGAGTRGFSGLMDAMAGGGKKSFAKHMARAGMHYAGQRARKEVIKRLPNIDKVSPQRILDTFRRSKSRKRTSSSRKASDRRMMGNHDVQRHSNYWNKSHTTIGKRSMPSQPKRRKKKKRIGSFGRFNRVFNNPL